MQYMQWQAMHVLAVVQAPSLGMVTRHSGQLQAARPFVPVKSMEHEDSKTSSCESSFLSAFCLACNQMLFILCLGQCKASQHELYTAGNMFSSHA